MRAKCSRDSNFSAHTVSSLRIHFGHTVHYIRNVRCWWNMASWLQMINQTRNTQLFFTRFQSLLAMLYVVYLSSGHFRSCWLMNQLKLETLYNRIPFKWMAAHLMASKLVEDGNTREDFRHLLDQIYEIFLVLLMMAQFCREAVASR